MDKRTNGYKADEVEEMGGKLSFPGAVAICLYWQAKESGAQVPSKSGDRFFFPLCPYSFSISTSHNVHPTAMNWKPVLVAILQIADG